jgi:hypothetical protein
MQKMMLTYRGEPNENFQEFEQRILKTAEGLLDTEGIMKMSLTITKSNPPKLSVIPFSKNKIAILSIQSSREIELKNLSGLIAAYLVTEALPVAYGKGWKDGETTPGACLLTLFNKKKKQSYDDFYKCWHEGHTPLSLEIHPLWHYNRNVVNTKIFGDETWDGIVEEHVKDKKQLLNPIIFFGGAFKMLYNMIRVYTDTKKFIDFPSMETYLVQETWLKSAE